MRSRAAQRYDDYSHMNRDVDEDGRIDEGGPVKGDTVSKQASMEKILSRR